jgi:hypothetical protein
MTSAGAGMQEEGTGVGASADINRRTTEKAKNAVWVFSHSMYIKGVKMENKLTICLSKTDEIPQRFYSSSEE